MSGRRTQGECGHVVEYIVGQFALCTVKGCDGQPNRCPRCGGKMEPFASPGVPVGAVHCWSCGRLAWKP